MYGLPALFDCLSDNTSLIVCLVLLFCCQNCVHLIFCLATFLAAFCCCFVLRMIHFFVIVIAQLLHDVRLIANKNKTSDLFVEWFWSEKHDFNPNTNQFSVILI